MISFWRFVRRHPALLAYGVSGSFTSSFGQTFFVALLAGSIQEAFGLSTGKFGTIYSVATLVSALMLPRLGQLVDIWPARRLSLLAGVGLLLSLGLLASTVTWWMLFPALLGVRFFGQGTLGTVPQTVISRVFEEDRGKALSVSSIGFPLGEATVPAITLLALETFGWRGAVLAAGGAAFLLSSGLGTWLLSKAELDPNPIARDAAQAKAPRTGKARLWTDPVFVLLATSGVSLPFLGTALFLYLPKLYEARGWPVVLVATVFAGYAGTRATASLLSGPLIDRFSGSRLYPLSYLPFAVALLLLAFGEREWTGFVAMGLVGVSFGAGTIGTAMMVEIFGRERIGSVRGSISAVGIFGAAASPALVGNLIDFQIGFHTLLLSGFGVSVACALAGATAIWLARRRKTGHARASEG